MAEGKSKSNYAINPTPELDLRSNRAVQPARVIAALDIPEAISAVLVVMSFVKDKRERERCCSGR